jgi:hypothetical protein
MYTTLFRFNCKPSINFEVETCGQIDGHDVDIVFTVQGTYDLCACFMNELLQFTQYSDVISSSPNDPLKIVYYQVSVSDNSDWNILFVVEHWKRSILLRIRWTWIWDPCWDIETCALWEGFTRYPLAFWRRLTVTWSECKMVRQAWGRINSLAKLDGYATNRRVYHCWLPHKRSNSCGFLEWNLCFRRLILLLFVYAFILTVCVS